VGGESTAVVSKEFLQELPFEGIEPAWRRAVQALRRSPLNPETEPLLGVKDQKLQELTGDHPLFWAGYLIVSPAKKDSP
jgi:CHAT domain-containing protein